MEALAKETLERAYISGKSMWEISSMLGCSIHKVTYWMTKFQIKKRSRSEAMYRKLNPNGDPFKVPPLIPKDPQFWLGLGLGIYWGEGNKITPHSVRVTNSNPNMIKAFRKFLLEVCKTNPDKLQYSIVCFNDSNLQDVLSLWSTELNVPKEKFGKIVQIPPQGKGTYKRKSKSGVCTLTFGNIKLKKWIMEQISSVSPDSLVAKQALGKG